MMGMLFSIGMAAAEFAQDVAIEASGNTVDEEQDYGSSSCGVVEAATAFMYRTSLMIGSSMVGVDIGGPAAQGMMEAIEVVIEDPVAAIEAAEVGCHSNADCPSGFACVFSPGAEAGTCIKLGEIGVRIVGVIDGVTCAFCLSQIGRTGALDSMPIPPFHKYCRCSLEYLE
jgi:hypothetical protein